MTRQTLTFIDPTEVIFEKNENSKILQILGINSDSLGFKKLQISMHLNVKTGTRNHSHMI